MICIATVELLHISNAVLVFLLVLLPDSRFFHFSVRLAVKTNPPSHVRAMSEESFPTSLLLHWTHPLPEEYITLIYQIRFCAQGSSDWDYVSSRTLDSFFRQACVKDLVCEMFGFSLRFRLKTRPRAFSPSDSRIFNQTPFTSLKSAASTTKRASTGATGAGT